MSYSRDGGLEAKFNSIVDGLRAHDSSLLGEHLKTSDAARVLVVLNRFKEFLVDDNFAWDVVWGLALVSLHLGDDHLFVGLDSLVLDFFEHIEVGFPASDEDFTLHEFDEALKGIETGSANKRKNTYLDEEILEQFLVSCLIRLHLLLDLRLGLHLELFDILIHLLHSLDSLLVLLL